nr:fibronectin type III domain-containing protein [Nitrospirales bacterium]
MVKHMPPLDFTAMHLAGLTLSLVGLFASPAFSASSIQLTWDANPEPDLMGYYVHMGTSQGSYNTTKNPGLTPSYIFQNLPEGSTYYFTVTAYDQSGNISEPAQEVAITLPTQGGNVPPPDTTPPTMTLVGPQNSSPISGTITVSATASDNIGVVGVQFKLNGNNLGPEDTTNPFSSSWNTTAVSDGSYTLSATARDAAGNTTTAAPVNVTVSNTTSPGLTISNLTVASGQAYVVQTSGLQTGGTVYIDRTFSFTTVPSSMQGAASIRTANDDKEATNPAFFSFTVNQPVSVSVAHDVRITPKPSWLSTFTDTGANLVTSDTTLRLFGRSFRAGTITLGGNAGNGYSMYSVIVQPEGGTQADTTPPTITITAPSAGTISSTVSVRASASDNVGVTGVQFRLQGANLGPEDTSSPYRTNWNTTTTPNGSYTLTAIARDAAGNTKTAASVTVTVNNTSTPPPPPADTTPPTVTLTTPSAGTVSGTVTVSASASDNVGVTGVQFRLQGANLGAEDTTNPLSSSWNTTTVSNGSYTLTAIARDAAGNTTTATPVTVTVSNNILPKKYD